MFEMRWLAAILLLGGCTSTDWIKCPASPPQGVECVACKQPALPGIDTIEDMEGNYLALEQELIKCQGVNRECVARDKIWIESWNEDCEE